MAAYAELGDVRTWYGEHGAGEPLALLHPGGADARAWGPNLDALAAHFHVYTPERRGHGRTPDVEGPFTYELMADDTTAFLEEVVGGPAHLVELVGNLVPRGGRIDVRRLGLGGCSIRRRPVG